MSKMILGVQPLILTVSGQLPTIPNPSTIMPDDNRFDKSSDIMVGQLAYNVIDDEWYYRGYSSIQSLLKASTITVDQVETWQDNKTYKSGNVFVSFVNVNSSEDKFQNEAIYRCKENTLVGESPESNPDKWVYQGKTITVDPTTTIEIITIETASAFDPNKEDGYLEGSIISYKNEASLDPQFQTLELYLANADIPMGVTPEQSIEWVFKGQEITQQNTYPTVRMKSSVSTMKQIVDYKEGDIVFIRNSNEIYEFTEGVTTGEKPDNIDATETGRWVDVGGESGGVSALDTTFDNSTNGFTSNNVQEAIEENKADLDAHIQDKNNPHETDAFQVPYNGTSTGLAIQDLYANKAERQTTRVVYGSYYTTEPTFFSLDKNDVVEGDKTTSVPKDADTIIWRNYFLYNEESQAKVGSLATFDFRVRRQGNASQETTYTAKWDVFTGDPSIPADRNNPANYEPVGQYVDVVLKGTSAQNLHTSMTVNDDYVFPVGSYSVVTLVANTNNPNTHHVIISEEYPALVSRPESGTEWTTSQVVNRSNVDGASATDALNKLKVGVDDINTLAKNKSYTIDFMAHAIIAQEINMFGSGKIVEVDAENVSSIKLTYSGGVQQNVNVGINSIDIISKDLLIWEITRTNDNEIASLGILLKLD